VAARAPLPTPVKTRLAETDRKHALTLKKLLEETSKQEFVAAVAEGSTDALLTKVYPLERAFEILVNFVVELAALGSSLPRSFPTVRKRRC
jgi:hypothetical protein